MRVPTWGGKDAWLDGWASITAKGLVSQNPQTRPFWVRPHARQPLPGLNLFPWHALSEQLQSRRAVHTWVGDEQNRAHREGGARFPPAGSADGAHRSGSQL